MRLESRAWLVAGVVLASFLTTGTASAVTGEQVGKVQLLDDLNRNDPPGSFSSSGMGAGKWSKPTAYGQGATSKGGAYNSGGRLGYGSPGGWAGAYWNPQKFVDKGNGVAVKATLTAPMGNGEAIALWLNQPSPTTSVTGYELYIGGSSSMYQGTAYLYKWTNGSSTTLASSVAVTQPGTTYALVEKNGEITAWGSIGGSGFLNPPGYKFTDGSPQKEGYAGLQVAGTGPSLSDFSAGPLPPAKPTLTSTSPASPGPSTTPSIAGSAESGTTVRLYANSACSGSPIATGTAASFASPGLTATVASGSTTTFYATATNSDELSSSCSNSSVTYTQDSTPPSPPTFSWTDPASPGKSKSPRIAGSAESGSTVKLYSNGTCTGSPLATGTAAAFSAPGLSASVAENSSTNFRATATDAAGNVSSCSSPIAYVNDAEHILFEGAYKADFAEPVGETGAISEVPDPLGSGRTVLKFTPQDDEKSEENPRAQLPSPAFIESGDEFWLRSKVLIPEDFPSVPGWLTLVSVFGAPSDGTGPWRFEIKDDEFLYQRNGTYGFDIPWGAPLIKGSWVEVMLHERFGKEGWLEFWLNGTKVKFFGPESWNPGKHPETEKLAMATMDASNDKGPNSARIGQYRENGMFKAGSVYYQFIKVGTTRESVGG